MSELTYEDFKQRINIQEVLQDAGYHLNRKDGIRYPSYVRLDSNGRRIRGDKFIVTRNGMCCFQPPEQRNYNIISFIKEHPHFFAEYTPGMSKDAGEPCVQPPAEPTCHGTECPCLESGEAKQTLQRQ